MKAFISRITLFALIAFCSMELISRLLLDPFFKAKTDTYNQPKETLTEIFNSRNDEHVDFLFIGSSRVPASINFKKFGNQDMATTVVAGRGKMTPGIHYQAIKNRLDLYPNYLKGSTIFLEYPGSSSYTKPFYEDRMSVSEAVIKADRGMPHLIIPHLTNTSLFEYLRYSSNSNRVKCSVTALYTFSTYRSSIFVNEVFHRLDTPFFESNKNLVAKSGGIRNDAIKSAKSKALKIAQVNRKKSEKAQPLSIEELDNSTISKLKELITEAGGKLVLFEMPLHSIQSELFSSKKEINNKAVFDKWLTLNNIDVVENPNFSFADEDFPDTWHLSIDRRDEFTQKLFIQFTNISKNEK